MTERGSIGKTGEALAARFLISKGYRICAQNFWTRFGEIDIIGEDGETLVFVEVKTRTSIAHGAPYEQVSHEKMVRCRRACELYILEHPHGDRPLRIDVISIVLNTETHRAQIQHFKNITAA